MLQEIRKKLRLAMNGINSSSMREKGIDYKLNFGVPVMTLRKMAQNYAPDRQLAEELWHENTRELKILATLIQPPSTFAHTLTWVKDINNLELAEQASMNLFSKTPDAQDNALQLIQSKNRYSLICGFLIYTRLFMNNHQPADKNAYFSSVFKALDSESLLIRNAALTSLKKLGRQSAGHANEILSKFDTSSAVYNELKFEYDCF